MDPINNGRPPYPPQHDATFSPPDPRRELGHHAPAPPVYWAPNQTAVPTLYSMYSPYPPNLDSPLQMGLSSGPPLPDPTPRGYLPYPHPMSMAHPAPWNDSFPQMPGPIQTNHGDMPTGQGRPRFGSLPPFAPADNDLEQSGLAMASDVPPHGIYESQHHLAIHPDHVVGHSETSLQTPNSSSFRRSSYTALPGINPRASRPPLPSTLCRCPILLTLDSFHTMPLKDHACSSTDQLLDGSLSHQYDPSGLAPHTHRRGIQSRARRPLTTRSPTDPIREIEENRTISPVDQMFVDRRQDESPVNNAAQRNARQTQATDSISRKTAWKFAHHVLKKVEVQDLPESERSEFCRRFSFDKIGELTGLQLVPFVTMTMAQSLPRGCAKNPCDCQHVSTCLEIIAFPGGLRSPRVVRIAAETWNCIPGTISAVLPPKLSWQC